MTDDAKTAEAMECCAKIADEAAQRKGNDPVTADRIARAIRAAAKDSPAQDPPR